MKPHPETNEEKMRYLTIASVTSSNAFKLGLTLPEFIEVLDWILLDLKGTVAFSEAEEYLKIGGTD